MGVRCYSATNGDYVGRAGPIQISYRMHSELLGLLTSQLEQFFWKLSVFRKKFGITKDGVRRFVHNGAIDPGAIVIF